MNSIQEKFQRHKNKPRFSCLPAVEQAGWLLPTPRDWAMQKRKRVLLKLEMTSFTIFRKRPTFYGG